MGAGEFLLQQACRAFGVGVSDKAESRAWSVALRWMAGRRGAAPVERVVMELISI